MQSCTRRLSWLVGAGLLVPAFLSPWGCGANGDGSSKAGTQVTGPNASAASGAPNSAPAATTNGTGVTPPSSTEGGMDFSGFDVGPGDQTPPVCQQASRSFVPKVPTVFILVDRSHSMFDPI